MVRLLILKQLENLSDEQVILQWKRNPYYQAFCGLSEFQQSLPCHSTELVKFRQRIGQDGFERIFQMSITLHGRLAPILALYSRVNSSQRNESHIPDVQSLYFDIF